MVCNTILNVVDHQYTLSMYNPHLRIGRITIMITVGMDYKVIPGKDEEFVAVFDKVLGVMNDMAGHAESHLYRDVFSEHDYIIISQWSDHAAFDAFIASDRFKNVASWGKENVLAARPKHEIYGDDNPVSNGCPVTN